MKSLLAFILTILAVIGGIFFLQFGTLSPCAALKQEVKVEMLRSTWNTSPADKWSAAGNALGMALAGPMIDTMIGALTPMQCLNGLTRIYVHGESFISNDQFQTPTQPAALAPPSWDLSQEKSPIDDSTNVFLSMRAHETLTDWLGTAVTPKLWLQCLEKKTSAVIVLDLQPDSDYGYDEGEYVAATVRFDKTPASREHFSLSTSRKDIFFHSALPTIKKMLAHRSLLVQFRPFQQGSQTLTFDLTGLAERIGPLRQACKW